MAISKTPVSGGYFADRDFINTKTSLTIALFDYFSNLLFNGDSDRIVYASNDYAFRGRISSNKRDGENDNLLIQNLNIPFMNFYMTNIQQNTTREWKSHALEVYGKMDWDLRKKIKATPIKISFEGIVFTEKETDRHFVISEIAWENSLETLIKPQLQIDDLLFDNIAVLSFSPNNTSQYNENDWLQKNRIRTTSIDFEIDTFLVKTTTEHFCVPTSVLFTFARAQNIDILDWDDYDLLLTGVIDHLNGEVVF